MKLYVPRSVVDEIKNIQVEEQLASGSEAFRKMAIYCKIGKEAKKKNWDSGVLF